MLKTKSLLSVLAIAAFSGAALAQSDDTAPADTATSETAAPADGETPETTENAAQDPAADLDTGQPESGGVGQGYVRETFGDWQLQCVRQEDTESEPCQLYQLLRGAEDNPVAEVIIEKLPEGGNVAAGATILVPFGTALAKDLRIAVDGSQGKVYRYAFCNSNACYARIGLLPADIAAFKAGNTANVTIFAYERLDEPVELTLSLSGFTAGFETLQPVTPPQ
ncbi:hypothetical protein OB2597_03674 [Pseudooceanicola batsensis HTCC2597]|uniref:Invasion associated family protein n=1 Tax=Pseudooceanicola batsensis (strain ATCC BAA-863 / DSM 15984 / KCTC 12145 / HTCC2597) TaxID=252305 RepID=A3U3R8_PSEBH|nr:invasion associated locus B family protein [Pseudooceanicola batsensis]EAQ01157.1 hypothetical protein OB2597_03674 [Pseudooceanicola batsensis HTCC2597]